MPPYPERWSVPVKEVRQYLKEILIEDRNDCDNFIKRKLIPKEINKLIAHWRDMVMYSKQHFKNTFDPDILLSRPYLRFIVVGDSRTCDFCKLFNNKVIRSSNPKAAQFFPPLHIGCRCTIVTHSERELKRDGFIESWPEINLPHLFQIPIHIP